MTSEPGLLAGLPFEFGPACRSDSRRATELEHGARMLRPLLDSRRGDGFQRFLDVNASIDAGHVPALAQMLPAEIPASSGPEMTVFTCPWARCALCAS